MRFSPWTPSASVALVGLCAACTIFGGRPSERAAPPGTPQVTAGSTSPRGELDTDPYLSAVPAVVGDTLIGAPPTTTTSFTSLHHMVGGPYGQSAKAILTSNSRLLVYETFRRYGNGDSASDSYATGIHHGNSIGRPAIRIKDLSNDADTLLADGATSPALRADGALAYVQGIDRDWRLDTPWVGRVVVRSSLTGAPATWIDAPDRYIVAAWAGNTLLVYRQATDSEATTLLAVDGPGKVRRLLDGKKGRDDQLVAVSPDGTRVLIDAISEDTFVDTAFIVDVASGQVTAKATLPSGVGLRYDGDWKDDLIVSGGGNGLVVMKVSGSNLNVFTTVPLNDRKMYPYGIQSPRFAAQNIVVASADVAPSSPDSPSRSLRVQCMISTRICVHGPIHEASVYYPVTNQSRP